MASAPKDPGEVQGRVDRSGRLTEADPELAQLQTDAGSTVGDLLALPQLAAIARLALRLGIAVERQALVADGDRDIDLLVRAVPEGESAALSLQRWEERPAAPSRLSMLSLASESVEPESSLSWAVDPELRLTSLSPELAVELETEVSEGMGLPLTRVVQLIEDDTGDMPLLTSLATRRAFAGQRARSRGEAAREMTLEGEAVLDQKGRFAGFAGRAMLSGPPTALVRSTAASPRASVDSALDSVLRSPLDRIIAEAERITNRADGPLRSDYASYGNDIVAAARHLLSVIEAMGDDPQFGQAPIDLAALAAEAVMLAEPVAEERNVRIELDPAAAVHASGEERAVIQILVNLITNAVRHSPERGRITIQFQSDNGRSSVSVTDQGPGIDPADQVRIFEKFERVEETGTGIGLGLAIARRLARSMDGDVTVVSATGQGARFILTLPSR